jgi:large subunit ribosomal protein L11
VQLTALSDRSFTFEIRSPPTSYLIKKAANIEKGANHPNPDALPVGYISPEQVYEIARIKHQDKHRAYLPLEGVARSVVGTATSIGVRVRENEPDTKPDEEAA